MFYIKTQLTPETSQETEIHEDNVFTRCPGCGEEIAVDMCEIFADGDADLYGTTVFCKACSRKKLDFGTPITFDGLSWLIAILSKAGYGELLEELFDEFGITSLTQLPPKLYQKFGNALSDMACGTDTEGGRDHD